VTRLGLAILGCGWIARRHATAARALRRDLDFFFASRDPGEAEFYRSTFGAAAAFGSYEAALRAPEVDGVVICTPHDRHVDDVLLAAAHGKHVLVEKPIARRLDEANSLATPGMPRIQWSTISGTDGSIFVDHRGRFLRVRSRRGQRVHFFGRDRRGHVAMLREFVDAVRVGRPPETDGAEGKKDLAVVLAAYRSLATGQPVEVAP
jgi:predicted dehydrogenase